MYTIPLAHIEVDELGIQKSQSLTDHLLQVGKIAADIGDKAGIKHIMMQVGYLHDMGKADRAFQNYIQGISHKKVDHSSAGAKLWIHILDNLNKHEKVVDNIRFQYYKEIILYLIQSHHGLFNIINIESGKNKSIERLDYDATGEYHFQEDVLNYFKHFDLLLSKKYKLNFDEIAIKGYEEFSIIFDRLKMMAKSNPLALSDKKIYKREFQYYITCFIRLCLSILKEADMYDSANTFLVEKQKVWDQEELNNIWNDGYLKIEKIYSDYKASKNLSELNQTRTEMANQAKEFASLYSEGVFQLELPTGAGKTKSSLRYAFTNAMKYNKRRIFYITAFLSVLEQNAEEIKAIVQNDSAILEHHSNVILENQDFDEATKDSIDYSMLNYLKESWESPIILTTMVQFCNTLYKGKADQIRRFSKLIDSIIIIDEVQSLPLKMIYNFNLMMNFMNQIMHCNIVHCTATQPVLNSAALSYPVYYGDENRNDFSIVENDLVNRSCFDRVEYYNLTGKNATDKMSTLNIIAHVENTLSEVNSCLIVLNTKTAVKILYEELSKQLPEVKVIYLTTNLCAAHRLDLIQEMKDLLIKNRKENSNYKLICISTQLIEAGVDLDFDCIYRSMAGIDSLIQCAGRCNREGKLTRKGMSVRGKIYIINYESENLSNLQDIKQTIDASQEAIRAMNIANEELPISLDEIKQYYYNKYYVQNESKLYYWDEKEKETMIEELSMNRNRRNEFKQLHCMKYPYQLAQSFRTAADHFELIKQDTVGVIVYYKNDELINRLQQAIYNRDRFKIMDLLKKLQRTTVNVYNNEKLAPYIHNILGDERGELNGQILLLDKPYYDENMGIVTDGLADFII
ncbi:MAG: CRISPR-associated helicase Cas3' [Clostridiales bacterium]|nr:CRISPR-associated helicase Cas3' [Clostridiales bacterium]